MIAAPLIASLLIALSLSDSATARPTTFVPNLKLDNVKVAASSSDSFWVSTGSSFYVPGQAADFSAPSSSPSSTISAGRSTPAVTLTPPTNLPIPSITSAPTSSTGASLAKRAFNPLSLQESLLAYRADAKVTPTPWTPAQLARASLLASISSSKASVSSSKSAASAAAVTTTSTTRTVNVNGATSRTTSKSTSQTTTTSKASTTTKTTTTTSKTTTTTSKSTTTKTTTTPTVSTTSKTTTTSKSTTTSSTSTSSSASATSTGPGLTNGKTYWKEKTYFYSLASFAEDVVQDDNYSWGEDNIAVVQGVPANNWTDGVQGDTKSALQVAYPAGSRNPGKVPAGGVGFYSSEIDITAATNVSLSYSVFFPTGFDFVKGGKLPGLYGGAKACSGGNSAETCFSTRLMFRTGGKGELYLYAPREKQVEALCSLGPLSYCNSVYGMSIGRGSWVFKTGEWTDIRQDIWLNTPGQADGGFNIWVNGELVLHSDAVYYRNAVSSAVVTSNSSTTIDLIDYDSLPDNITIPNGGFSSYSDISNSTTSSSVQAVKVVDPDTATTFSSSSSSSSGVPNDWQNKKRALVDLKPRAPSPAPAAIAGAAIPPASRVLTRPSKVPVEKRATTTVAGFLGGMMQTFFGGSSDDYDSPTLQYSYFRTFALNINS
ncbi:hypothetical protein JCM1840_007217 [Sporobolomyces johnsonii]